MIFSIHTLGCRTNTYQSEGIRSDLEEHGHMYAGTDDIPDLIIINTCTVTSKAAKKSRKLIRNLRKKYPHAKIIVTGCHTAFNRKELADMKETDIVTKYGQKKAIPDIAASEHVPAPDKAFPFTVTEFRTRTRALLMVQDGCDAFCSYCILPYIRGPLKSRDPEEILHEARLQIENGYPELVITGIHTGAYGRDLKKNIRLEDILSEIIRFDGDFRIRLSSIEIGEITPGIIHLMQTEDKVCPHLHIPLQSGSDTVLNRMNRKYTISEFIEKTREIRSGVPECALSTDIICGFPGETEKDFNKTLQAVREIEFSRIHAFPFSPRKKTKAATMKPEIKSSIIKKRVKKIISEGRTFSKTYAQSFKGKTVTVIPETRTETGKLRGYSEHYVNTKLNGPETSIGTLINVNIKNVRGNNLVV